MRVSLSWEVVSVDCQHIWPFSAERVAAEQKSPLSDHGTIEAQQDNALLLHHLSRETKKGVHRFQGTQLRPCRKRQTLNRRVKTRSAALRTPISQSDLGLSLLREPQRVSSLT